MCGKEKLMQNTQSALSTSTNRATTTTAITTLSVEDQYQTPPLDDEKPECSNAIQSLYNACKATFSRVKGPFPAEGLDMVRALLGMPTFLV